jgi:uncharacterized protein
MSPDLERLIELQRLDTAIADAKDRIAAHPQRVIDADARLTRATEALDASRQRLKDNQEARRALEREAAVYQGRLTKFKDQLSAVKTNREYQAMQLEIETAQKELGAAEERLLERMLEGDAIGAEVKRAEAALAAEQRAVDAEKQSLDQELAATESALAAATAERTSLMAALNAELVALFTRVARMRKGVAISTATRDGLCSVCHVRLRPHVFQQVRHNNTIVQCESCQRILYYVPPPPAAEGAVVRTS